MTYQEVFENLQKEKEEFIQALRDNFKPLLDWLSSFKKVKTKSLFLHEWNEQKRRKIIREQIIKMLSVWKIKQDNPLVDSICKVNEDLIIWIKEKKYQKFI